MAARDDVRSGRGRQSIGGEKYKAGPGEGARKRQVAAVDVAGTGFACANGGEYEAKSYDVGKAVD
ncbi:hypothetical protein B0H14DRAFT_3885299 [Mycena olivaceomarginata]|nr:hypothetical protein B0H14DRAFT_3885299 [Mycena olivaceomarginata]